MTAGEFRAWMDGFLRGRDKLSKGDIDLIKAKSQEVVEGYRWYPYTYPYSAPTWTTTSTALPASTVPEITCLAVQ